MKRLNVEIDEFDKGRDEKYEKNKLIAHQLDGLMERIHISHEIGGIVPWLIFLILLSIEAGPIFFKMMMTKGAYDFQVENTKKRFEAYNGIYNSNEFVHGPNGALLAEEWHFLEVDKELRDKRQQIDKQTELTSVVLEHYTQKKKKDISENPENFYSEEK